jgi:arsenate reductase-like glutaredoxin family protein
MNNKEYLLNDKVDGGFNHMYSQMMAPLYALSNLFLSSGNFPVMEPESKNESAVYTLDTSKVPPKVHSILEQKIQANELEDYITKLVEQDLEKVKKEETKSLFDTLREEFLTEISKLKQELAANPVEMESERAYDLRNSLTRLSEEKLDKIEFQTLISSFRSEILEQITLLKNELAYRPAVPAKPGTVWEQMEEANDLKEGQLLESNRVTGTIKEVIDVDF